VLVSGDEAATLQAAGAARADVVIAVTGDDEDNLVICQVARAHFNVPRTIARVNNPTNEDFRQTSPSSISKRAAEPTSATQVGSATGRGAARLTRLAPSDRAPATS
jgi:Trk K+ transport system NAD-binding subunit